MKREELLTGNEEYRSMADKELAERFVKEEHEIMETGI